MAKAEKNNVVGKVLTFLAIGMVVAGGSFGVYHLAKNVLDEGGGIIEEQKNNIQAPKNVKYNEFEKLLTWDKVDNAKNYLVTLLYDGHPVYQVLTKDNYDAINFDSTYIKYFKGDKLEFIVDANSHSGETETTKYEHVLQYDFDYTNELINIVLRRNNCKNTTSFDFIDFAAGQASGQINHIRRNKEYFTYFIKKSEPLKAVESYKDFYYNFQDSSYEDSQYISGYKQENEQVKQFMMAKANINADDYEQVFTYKDAETELFSLCTVSHSGKYEFYTLNGKFSGTDEFILEKIVTHPDYFTVDKYFEISKTNKENPYLSQLNNALEKHHQTTQEQGMEK